MLYRVVFKDHNAFLIREEDNEETVITDHRFLIYHLNSDAQIFKNFNFGDFLRILEPSKDILQVIFNDVCFGKDISPIFEEYKKEVDTPSQQEEEGVRYLVIDWLVDMFEGKLSFYPNFRGVGPVRMAGELIEDGTWGIMFTAVNELCRYPLALDETFKVFDVNNPHREVLTSRVSFTLGDMIRAVLDELTWFVSSSSKKAELDRLDEEYEKAQEELEGGAKLRSFDELREDLSRRREARKYTDEQQITGSD